MFGVNSAAHAASRSAKTSSGAARNIAIVWPSSVSSTLNRRNPRIPDPIISLTPAVSKHLDELGLDCVKTRAAQVPELGGFLALPMIARLHLLISQLFRLLLLEFFCDSFHDAV